MNSILVVDDDSTYRMLLARAFKVEGLEEQLRMVACGEEALAALTQNGYKVALLDLNLPDMSGVDVLCWARNRPATRDLPILLYSWNIGAQDQDRAQAAGVTAILQKVGSFDELRALARQLYQDWAE